MLDLGIGRYLLAEANGRRGLGALARIHVSLGALRATGTDLGISFPFGSTDSRQPLLEDLRGLRIQHVSLGTWRLSRLWVPREPRDGALGCEDKLRPRQDSRSSGQSYLALSQTA